jgi:hypothetical protein
MHAPEEGEETKPETKPSKEASKQAKQTHRSSMHGHGKLATIDDDGTRRRWLVTWAALTAQLSSVGTARRPTRTSASTVSLSNRTSTFAASTPSLRRSMSSISSVHSTTMHPSAREYRSDLSFFSRSMRRKPRLSSWVSGGGSLLPAAAVVATSSYHLSSSRPADISTAAAAAGCRPASLYSILLRRP